MKNLNFIVLFIFLFLFIFFNSIKAQTPIVINQTKEEFGYLIYFEQDVTPETIDSIKNAMNSYEVWITNHSKIRYWKVNDFPFDFNNVSITNLEELNSVVSNDTEEGDEDDGETEIGSISYNYLIEKEIEVALTGENNIDCNGELGEIEIGENSIIIDVLDTGFDFIDMNTYENAPNVVSGYNFVSSSSNIPQDDNGHGTHLTSIINDVVYQNDNPKISIYESKTHNEFGIGKLSDIILAIDHSIDINANIINASWSFYAQESDNKTCLEIAIEVAGENNILFITAAGNMGIDVDNNLFKSYPASYNLDNVLSVASVSCDASLSSFSNFGNSSIDIAAMGENVLGYVLEGQILEMSGTSQSTAYVSGIAAVLGSHISEFDPFYIKQMIIDGADYNASLENVVYTEGTINMNTSLSLMNIGGFVKKDKENVSNQLFLEDYTFLKTIESDINEFQVFPNPFMDDLVVSINSDVDDITDIEILDMNGELVLLFRGGLKKEINVDTSELLPGMYIIKNGSQQRKIIKLN